MTNRLRVLVVGASIAGPAAAHWLAKAGAVVTVIERFPGIRKGGQAVDIRASGVTVMRRVPGMEEQVQGKAAGEDGVAFVRSDGRPYGVIRATNDPDQQSLISEFEILRGDLAHILYDMTVKHRRIKYVFGEQIASIEDRATTGPVDVHFANGMPSSTFDLIVAADGAASRIRAMGFGCGVRDHVFPTDTWAAYFSTQRDFLNGSSIGHGISAPGGRFMSVGSNPRGGGLVTLISNGNASKLRKAIERGEDRDFVAQHYQGIGWIGKEVISEMLTAEDFYANEIVQVKIPALSRGRMVLVGDAGYAVGPTGLGTSIALTGAYILAGEIGKHPDDLEAALAGYEQQMRPLITKMQKIPPFVTSIVAPQSAWAIWLRNNLFGLLAWSGIAELLQTWFGGAAFRKTDEFPLPDYDWIE